MIEGHGDDIYRYEGKVRLNFSSNLYHHVSHDALKEHLAGCLDLVDHYPEPTPSRLEKMIAEREGISPESVMVTGGVTEAIYLIARLTHHSASIIPQPTFNEYADACRMNDHIISYENTDELMELPMDRVYWLCNPNNPSGNVLMKGFMDYLVRRSPRYTFVVDQSYATYTLEPTLTAAGMADCHNLYLLHSMSKQYGIPGLRLGYVTAHPDLIQLLRGLQRPWAVDALAIEAGCFLLEHATPGIPDLKAYLEEAERLRAALREIEGIRVFETKTHFMLCEIEPATSTELKHYLIEQHGILIRDCHNFHGLSNHFFRVTAQAPDENDRLVSAILQYFGKDGKPNI